MFQDYAVTSNPDDGPPRVAALRNAMAAAGVDGFLVPRADAHQGEQVAPRDARLAWLTGFTGSAGLAVILADKAAMFVDGRYTLQVRAQCDAETFAFQQIPQDKPTDWAVGAMAEGMTLAFDPWLLTSKDVETWESALGPAGILFKPVSNLVDAIWDDQPSAPMGPVVPHDAALAGRTHGEKREEIGAVLREAGVQAAVLSLPDSICWLLNIRGSDIERVPIVQGFTIVHASGAVDLFTDPGKLTDAAAAHLGDAVSISPPAVFGPSLRALEGKIGVDKGSAPVWVAQEIEAGAGEIHWMRDPCILPKAIKTEAELSGARAAQLRDGAAVAEFLAWLDAEAPKGALTEIAVAKALEARRRAGNLLRDISFETISGAGPNGAIVHYRVTEETDRKVTPGELLLVDSGGQYVDGTTDITRTIATGTPPEGAIRAFTLVLKGMIAISLARWPEGLAGRDLDALARVALWQAGLDYDHGTGHGVGSYLGVHEGPQSLSRRSSEPLKPGMILSNEPGYYREGAFGIRIENLVAVQEPETPEGGDRPMLSFETLTLAPIDRRLIDPALLTVAERAWLDAYHARVRAALGPLVTPETAQWLDMATQPL